MWSRKPTPVARVPAPRAVERRASGATSVSPVLRVDLRRCGSSRRHSRGCAPPSTRRGPRSPRRARSRRPAGASAAAGVGGDADLRHAAAEVARRRGRRRSARRRRSAARGWSPRRSRRTRSPLAAPTNRQPARVTRGASASAPAPISCRCSGASASASASAASRSSVCTSTAAPASARVGQLRRERVEHAASGETATTSAAGAVLGLRAQVERERARASAPPVDDHEQVARAGEAVDPDRAATTWRLASCTYRLPGPTITSTGADRLGPVARARRSPARRPSR